MRLWQSSKEWKAEVEIQSEKKVKYFLSNNGGEYKSKEFKDFNKVKGVTRHFAILYIPQQNHATERMNRTLVK